MTRENTPERPLANVADPHDAALSTGAYALDALDGAERTAFEAALEASEELRAETTGLRDTAVELGRAVPEEDPGAALRARVLAAAAATPQWGAEDAEVRSLDAQRARSGPARVRSALVGIAAAAAVVVGISTAPLLTATPVNAMTSLASAPDARSAAVKTEAGGVAVLVWSGAQARSMLVVEGLAPLDADERYQLWYIDDAGPRSAGLFDASASGVTAAMLAGSMHAGDTVGVTVEPAAGSEAPTSAPVVVLPSA